MKHNIILRTDSYKVSHYRQYPQGTRTVHSYLESRGGLHPTTNFFGLQYLLKNYLEGIQVTQEKIAKAKKFFTAHFGGEMFNEAGWNHILNRHGGHLPVSIRAVPEGTSVPTGNVLMTIENTDPACYWLTNYLETLLVQVWYPTTVCTNSNYSRRLILEALERTGDPKLIDFKLHDFGYRGSTSVESAGIGGAAHLVNFNGTDTLAALELLADDYGEEMAGFSIPAAEHSTITSWGRENESAAYANMLKQYPTGLVAVVSDSYDIYRACRELWGKELKDQVLAREGTLVVRPDSGNPPDVVVGVLNTLGEAFGCTVNGKGFKVLNDKVRVIQGDGIDHEMIDTILGRTAIAGWSADNITFGSGGGLLQKVNRDTQRFAFKCSAIEINSEWQPVSKDPITDPGKRSKGGRLALVRNGDEFKTVTIDQAGGRDELVEVFRNGKLLVDQRFAQIRKRARA